MRVEGETYGLTTLLDAAARQYSVKIVCDDCGGESIFDSHALWYLFERRGWRDELGNLDAHLYCRDCWDRHSQKVRPTWLVLCRDQPTVTDLPLPPERQWKAALSRYRL